MLRKTVEENFSYTVDVRAVGNGMDAVSTAEIWNADIVLMDIEMPGLNGIEAAMKIAQNNPKTKLVFITAYGRFEYAREAVRLRAVDYLLKPIEDSELIVILERLIQELKQQEILHRQVKEIEEPQQEEVSQRRNDLLMKKVGDYVRKNYQYDISQEIICEILNMSTGYFSKVFHRYYGVKFIDYLTNVRIDAAKRLLKDSTKKNKDVGMMVGYQSSSYFSKMFKQKTGLTPSEFREQG